MADYRKLEVWKKAHSLALNAHRAATGIRGTHYTALRSQIVRAAASVPANIVEGREQSSDAAFARYLRISIGSTSELDYHLQLSADMGLIEPTQHIALSEQIAEVRRMLHGLIARLDQTKASPRVPTPTN